MSRLLERTEAFCAIQRDAAIEKIRTTRERNELDWMFLGLFSKLICGARGVRILVGSSLSSEALGLSRVNIEVLSHLEALLHDPTESVGILTDELSKANGGSVPDDAQTLLAQFRGEELRLLATLYIHWTQRQVQKAANDASLAPERDLEGVKEAPSIVKAVSSDGESLLGKSLWKLLRQQKHWHPMTYPTNGSTETLFKSLNMHLTYVIEYRFGSNTLHGSNFSDYLGQELDLPPQRWEAVVGNAQVVLCRAADMLEALYKLSDGSQLLRLAEEGNQLRCMLP